MENMTKDMKNISLNINKDVSKTLCNDILSKDTKYWLCSCASYFEEHSHTRLRPEAFHRSRVTKDSEDTDI